MSARPIHLLLVTYAYPPVLGGSEIEAQRVCAELLRRGYRVEVLCAALPAMPPVARWTDPYGVSVRIFGHGHQPPALDRVFALAVARTLWRERRHYDLVYFLMQGLHLAAGLPVARALGKPIVMKVSGSNLITQMRQFFFGRLELRWLRSWAYRVMVLNDGMVAEALAGGLRREQLLWMPNPVDTAEFAPCGVERRSELRAQLDVPPEAPLAVYVGRLAPEKELPSLIGGFALAARQVPEARLALIGDGPDGDSLRALAAATGLGEHIRFTGRLPMEGVLQWLQAGDTFTLVSSLEGFPCSLVEAMSVGLPSVVSDIPANAQLVDDGVHGLRVAVKNPAAIGGAMASLLTDAAQRARMGEAARRRVVENYSTAKVVDRYEDLFADAIGGLR